MRLGGLLVVPVLALAACQKPVPRSSAQAPHAAQQIRTLTHDPELASATPADWSRVGQELRRSASP